jgi:hypothetical protein
LYIIFSTYRDTGIPRQLLQSIFPGATLEDWNPVASVTGKKQKALVALIVESQADGRTLIKKPDLIRELRLKDRHYLDRLLDDPNIVQCLQSRGIHYTHDKEIVILNEGLVSQHTDRLASIGSPKSDIGRAA